MKLPTPSVIIDYLSGKLKLNGFRARIASAILNKRTAKCTDVSDFMNLSLNIFRHIPLKYFGWSILPYQEKWEIQTLLLKLKERNVSAMLEIGTANGGTLHLFARVICEDAKIISIDIPGSKFGGGYESFKIPFFTNFALKNQRIFLIRADSHEHSSCLTVKAILEGQQLDFLFIDGDHTYEGVKKDFQMYSPFVRKGGLIALHDICEASARARAQFTKNKGNEVYKFWKEIKLQYSYEEIISNEKDNIGIGILYS